MVSPLFEVGTYVYQTNCWSFQCLVMAGVILCFSLKYIFLCLAQTLLSFKFKSFVSLKSIQDLIWICLSLNFVFNFLFRLRLTLIFIVSVCEQKSMSTRKFVELWSELYDVLLVSFLVRSNQ